jgi:hypothetical protein
MEIAALMCRDDENSAFLSEAQDIGMGVMCHGGAILEISTKDESQQGISLFRL